MDEHEMIFSDDDENDVKEASQVRHNAVQTIGNLTLITQPLNSSVSNSAWADKKPALMKSSLLPIVPAGYPASVVVRVSAKQFAGLQGCCRAARNARSHERGQAGRVAPDARRAGKGAHLCHRVDT